MYKDESVEIGGLKYTVIQLGAVTGKSVLLKLTKCLGPMIGSLFDKDKDFAHAFQSLELSDEDLTFFCETFARNTRVTLPDGKTPILKDCFDTHFAGKYLEMFQWLAFCCKFNFTSFLGDAKFKAVAQKLIKRWQVQQGEQSSESSPPTTSIGSSGVS